MLPTNLRFLLLLFIVLFVLPKRGKSESKSSSTHGRRVDVTTN